MYALLPLNPRYYFRSARCVRYGYASRIGGRVMDTMERRSPTGHPSFVVREAVPARNGLSGRDLERNDQNL